MSQRRTFFVFSCPLGRTSVTRQAASHQSARTQQGNGLMSTTSVSTKNNTILLLLLLESLRSHGLSQTLDTGFGQRLARKDCPHTSSSNARINRFYQVLTDRILRCRLSAAESSHISRNHDKFTSFTVQCC